MVHRGDPPPPDDREQREQLRAKLANIDRGKLRAELTELGIRWYQIDAALDTLETCTQDIIENYFFHERNRETCESVFHVIVEGHIRRYTVRGHQEAIGVFDVVNYRASKVVAKAIADALFAP